jgi:hypothetical protein
LADPEPAPTAPEVDPRYTGGRLVQIVQAKNPTEARLMQSVLMDAGIPSIDRPTRAFDILDLLAVGPRDILVSAAAVEDARALLGLEPPITAVGSTPAAFAEPPSRLLAKFALALVAAVGIVWLLWQLFA